MSTRIRLVGTGLLLLAFSALAAADGIQPGGLGQNIGGGFNFENGISRTGKAPTFSPPPTCNGVLNLSTGCSQLVAFGGLF